jgi:hypothetical protein
MVLQIVFQEQQCFMLEVERGELILLVEVVWQADLEEVELQVHLDQMHKELQAQLILEAELEVMVEIFP